MPVYEYRCTQCEHQFEEWQEVGAEAPPCPRCQSQVKKIFHPVRTIFKGSGFYITDTRAEKSKGSDKASPSTENKSSENKEGSEAKSDGKTTETSSAAGANTSSSSGTNGAVSKSDAKTST